MEVFKVGVEKLPAIFVDLDGTILNDDGRVDKTSARLLSQLKEGGVRVIVATARSPLGAIEAIEGLDFDPILVSLNGALVIDLARDEIIYESTLPNNNFKYIVETIEAAELGRHYLALQHRNEFIIESGFMDNVDFVIPHKVGEVRNYQDLASKLILRTESHSSSQLHHIFEARLSNHSYLSTSGEEWLDFSPAKISKATGAIEAAKHYGFSISDCIAIGNDLNDLELLRAVGHGFAVANARSKMRDDPSILSLDSDNNSEPLLEAIERWSTRRLGAPQNLSAHPYS
ncbi:MAG: HAD family hydrolase [Actinomycetota bacterium]|nr:HAD family hydrolase [Actinomycetota bacterium]